MRTKKEMKEAYRQMKFPMGVYKIQNLENGKIFLDSSNNLQAIWNRHRMQLNFGNHPNKTLQNDWNQLGEAKFKFEIIAEIDQDTDEPTDFSKELKILKELYLEELSPFGDSGYNMP